MDELQSIIQSRKSESVAGLQNAAQSRRKIVYVRTYDLTTAKLVTAPEILDFNFQSFWVVDASDSSTSVSLVANPQREGLLNDAVTLKNNLFLDLKYPIAGAQLYWSAQSGKTITIAFFTEGEVKPGSLVSAISGGVARIDGSSFTSAGLGSGGASASVIVASGAGTMILKADTSRKCATVYTDQAIWIGDSSVAVGTRGIPVAAGSTFEWRNLGALYACAVGVTATITGQVES